MGNEGVKAFLFFENYMLAIEQIDDVEDRAEAYRTIVEYGLYGKEPESKYMKFVLQAFRPSLDKTIELNRMRSEYGKKGAAKRWNGKKIANDSKAIAKDGIAIANDSKAIAKDARNKKQETGISLSSDKDKDIPLDSSLDFPLSGENQEQTLTWKERYFRGEHLGE